MESKDRLMKVGGVFLIALSVLVVAKIFTELRTYRFVGSDGLQIATITVTGEGEEVSKPDVADVYFTVLTEDKDAVLAQKNNSETMNKAIAYLKEQGVDEKDIKTVGYNLHPKYQYVNEIRCVGCPPSGRQDVVGYQVRNSVQVVVRDLESVGEILAGMGSLGVNDISGPNFRVDQPEAIIALARAKAIADAKKQAEVLADDLGVDLVRIVSFNEGGNPNMFYAKNTAFGMGGDAEIAVAPTIAPGENQITSSVSITYEIR